MRYERVEKKSNILGEWTTCGEEREIKVLSENMVQGLILETELMNL